MYHFNDEYLLNLEKKFVCNPLCTNGQLISKAIYGQLTSPKKPTDEFILFAFYSSRQTNQIHPFLFWENLRLANLLFDFILPLAPFMKTAGLGQKSSVLNKLLMAKNGLNWISKVDSRHYEFTAIIYIYCDSKPELHLKEPTIKNPSKIPELVNLTKLNMYFRNTY